MTLLLAVDLTAQGKDRFQKPRQAPQPDSEKQKVRRVAAAQIDSEEHRRLMLLKGLIDMPPERLALMQSTIRRIQNLSPEEKARLRERLDNFGRLPPPERRKLLEQFRNDERRRWDEFHRRHKHLSPDQRNRELRRIHSLPAHDRRKYFEKLHGGKFKDGSHSPHHPPSRREGPPRNPQAPN
ncbi:MAG: DUF3106 domain-containing protein [Opitutales bacterium]